MELKKHFPDGRGFPHVSIGKESVCKCRRTLFHSWVRKISWRRNRLSTPVLLGFPCGLAGKESACNTGDLGSIPGSGRSPKEENSYLLQYSCLENPMGRRTWQAIVHGIAESDMTD